jgi:hypothetical protein
VLDANALIALFEGRPLASEKVERLLAEALLHDVPLLLSPSIGEKSFTLNGGGTEKRELAQPKYGCIGCRLPL